MKNNVFFKKTPFEDNIDFGFDFGANLPPCWPPKSKIFRNFGLPRGLQNFIVFCVDFLLILAPSWPPTWGQDGSKFEKMGSKNSSAAPQGRFWIRTCFSRPFKNFLASIFCGSGLDFRWLLDDFSNFLAYFGHVFGCSCWGGYALPDPPALDLVFVVLG